MTKGHKKANKGNFEKPFVYRIYATFHARVGENVLKCCYWRGAYERERERECVCVCVSKISETTKYKALKKAKKSKFLCSAIVV